jgi:multidrug efflux pump subunit AcrA (membrane-fusion protein)
MKKIVFGMIILAVGLGGGYWYLRDGYMGHGPGTQKNENSDGEGGGATSDEKHGKAKKAPKPVPVTVAPVTKRRILRQVRVVGSLYGQDEITITPKVEGRILKTLADVGDRVKPGDTLLVIDDTDFRLAVNEAQRSLELELSRLGLKSLPKGDVDVSQLPLVVRAGFLERNSQIRKDRINRLGTSSPEEREQAETDNRVAQANYRQEGWQLEFDDFVNLWGRDWPNRGRLTDDLCMTRDDYDRPWALGNVTIVPRHEHVRRSWIVKRARGQTGPRNTRKSPA